MDNRKELQARWPKQNEFFYLQVLDLFPRRIRENILKIPAVKTELKKDRWLYIQGDNGTGKTMWASFVLLDSITSAYELNRRVFINVPELLMKFRGTFESKQSLEEVLSYYAKIPLLILDDLGVEKTTDWVNEIFYLLINRRYEAMLPTVITSNFTLHDLQEKFGDRRIVDRIKEMSEVVHLDGDNFRENRL